MFIQTIGSLASIVCQYSVYFILEKNIEETVNENKMAKDGSIIFKFTETYNATIQSDSVLVLEYGERAFTITDWRANFSRLLMCSCKRTITQNTEGGTL